LFAQVAGTYVNAKGPRFETKAEIRAFAGIGQVLGMTAAHEATACGELKLRYGMLCVVDNMCHGVGAPFDLDAFHAAQDDNRAALERVIELAVPRLETLACTIAAKAIDAAAAAASDGAGDSSSPEASPAAGDATPFSIASGPSTGSRHPVDLIVHARWVVPIIPHNMVFAHHAVVVRDGTIVAVLPSHQATAKYEAARIIHKPRHAIMPGLVNCHTHLGMTALRGLGDDKPLFEWLSTAIWPTEGRLMSSEYVRAGVQMGLAELLRGGTTCVNDMYFFPDVLAEELQRVGMRGCIGAPILEFPTAWAGSADEYLSKAEAMVVKGRADDTRGLLTYAISPHAPYTVADSSFVKIKAMADRLDTRIHVHLHETKAEVEDSVHGAKTPNKHLSEHKCAPVTNLVRMGVLSERTIAVHMANLSDEHLAEVAETGAHVVHCPHSNMKLASGFCRVADLVAAGVNVAIGTDSCASNNKLDMLGEMRTAAMLAKVVSSDPTAADAATALAMATINGAKAIGQADRTGSLSVGKSADMIAVDLSEIESLPLYDVQSHLVYATDRNQVTDVWVNGARLLAERKLTTIDYASCVASAHHWAKLVAPANEPEEDAGESAAGTEAAAASSSSS
jgi:5-methylthioadenosine/S-adenosylhomocysteine deaminase